MELRFIKPRHSLTEMKVRALCQTAATCASDLDGFRNWFLYEIKRMKSGNHQIPEITYELVMFPDRIEVWHRDPSGSRDRLISEVSK